MLTLLGIYAVGFVLTFIVLMVVGRGESKALPNALIFAAVWPAYVLAVLAWMLYPRG